MVVSDAFAAFIETTYDETLTLLVDTRDLLDGMPRSKVANPPQPLGHAQTMSAISRLTWQMTEIMSWLLLQKAIFVGELTLEEATKNASFNLPDFKDHEKRHDSPDVDLPVAVRGLIDRGRRIVDRATSLRGSLDNA